MRAIDTNVLVRLIVRDDLKQVTAAEVFIEHGAWVSLVVLTETMWVLAAVYERSAEELTIALEMLLDHKNLTVQDFDVVTAALDLFRAKPSVGFSDCLLLNLARKAGHLPLGTFDRALSRVEGTQKL